MKTFKFLTDNKPKLWGYIPFPFECQYSFMGSNDLWDAKDISNNLDDQMVIDILNRFNQEDILNYDENVQYVTITGQIEEDGPVIWFRVVNDDGFSYEDDLYI